MEIGLKIRSENLEVALFIESEISFILETLLGIKDHYKSKSFSNKSGALSFCQKIDLLIDIDVLSKKDKKKFLAFMEIRNQFMHNLEVVNYEKCFEFLNGSDKFLSKNYNQIDGISKEENLGNLVRQLRMDLINITFGLKKKLINKIRKDTKMEIYKKSQQAFIISIEELKATLDKLFEDEIKKGSIYNSKRLKGFGTELSKILYKQWEKNLKKLILY